MKARRNHRYRYAAGISGAIGLVALWASSSCAPSGFQDPSLLQNGVRILASSATHPYAAPGDDVTISVLAFDGRTVDQKALNPEPMHLYWLTTLCANPANEAYYSCFPQLATEFAPFESEVASGAAEAGPTPTDGGDGGSSDADAGPLVSMAPVVSSVSFSVPEGTIIPRLATASYGLLIKFNIACAGHLQRLSADAYTQNPQALPIGCFDSTGTMLGPESYVFGFTRVYVYTPGGPGTTNQNPVITSVDSPQPNRPDGAVTTSPPQTIAVVGTPPNLTTATPFFEPSCSDGGSCFNPGIGANLLPSSWELAANGQHEQIWAEYYSTLGSFKATSRLIYDPISGLIPNPDTNFQPPFGQSLSGMLWIVVHDNRGGAVWVTVPVQSQ